jgi:hypothetical protein
MDRLITTPITDSSQFPIKKGTLEFLQNANLIVLAELARNLIGDTYSTTKAYRLWGAATSTAGSTVTITEGAFFINGEIYHCPGNSALGPVVVLGIEVTQYGSFADPVTLSDGSIVNVHNIRQVKIYGPASPPPGTSYTFTNVLDIRSKSVFGGTSSSNALTVAHEYNTFTRLTPASGGITITISATNRAEGTKATIYVVADSSGNPITIAGGGTNYIVGNTAALGTGEPFMVAIEYAGSNTYFITVTHYEA